MARERHPVEEAFIRDYIEKYGEGTRNEIEEALKSANSGCYRQIDKKNFSFTITNNEVFAVINGIERGYGWPLPKQEVQ